MIIPSSVTDSITAAGIDVSNDWLSATAPVWNADYSAVLTQPISIAVTPLADMRFLGVTTATITIRISSAPLSLVSWSGIATLVADDTTGGGSPIYPVHNSFTGRDVADTHPMASITGLVETLAEMGGTVVEVANYAALPAIGSSGVLYVTLDDSKSYRWGGTAYVEISASLALGETSTTAYRGDHGKTAYDHSLLTSGNPHAVTAAEAGAAPAFVSDGARLFWATPNGAPGVPSLRAIVASDLPALPYIPTSNVSGTSGQVARFSGTNTVFGDNGLTATISSLTIGNGTTAAYTYASINGPASQFKALVFQDAGVNRWELSSTSAAAMRLRAYTSGSVPIDDPLLIANASGGTIALGGNGRPVNLTSGSKLQINGTDAITAARAGDLTALKIGSLAGTLISTAGSVSALSGTNLVLGNGTTIPQSTFVTAGSFLPLAGGTMANDALVTFNSTAANWEPSAIAINRPFIGGSQTQDAGIDISTGNGHGLRIALQSGNFYSGLQVNNASSEFAVELLLSGSGTKSLYAAGSVLIDGAVDAGAGVNVSGGAIQIAGDDAITAARAGDLTALKVGSLAGVLKGVAGDVAVASAGIDYTKPLDSVGTFSSISGTSLTAVYSLSIPGGTISNGGPCISFDFALNAQCVGATTETVSVYFGGALVGSFVCTATANTNFAIRLRGTMTWVSATSVLVDFWADIKNGLAGTYTVFNTSASLTLTLANPQTFEIRGQGSVAGNGLERFAGKVQVG